MRKALAILFLALATPFCALTPSLALQPSTAEAAVTPTRAERRVVAAINRVRAAHGLAKLSFRGSLIRAARSHTAELADRELLSHISENGWTTGERVRYFGYTTTDCLLWTVGENLACGASGTTYATPRAIVSGWMHSPAHREVLLTARLRDIGVGIHSSSDGMRYFTVDLGRRVR